MGKQSKKGMPPQEQKQQPGRESQMRPKPTTKEPEHKGSGKLQSKVALITGGDSGIGRSVAILFAREGADVAIVYYNEHDDAREAKELVEKEGTRCITIAGDIADPDFCALAVRQTVETFRRLDILVNNAGIQFSEKNVEKITDEHIERTFRVNIFAQFYLVRAALKHLKKGSCIINTSSVTAYRGSTHLLDYSSTKGAIVAFTRSLALMLVDKEIRVNAVAPGPIWTPLIPATFKEQKVEKFGTDVPMGRPGQPAEVAPCYVFLASDDSSYMTGQVLHPNGGEIING
jgi:NAD(P)-dependent dehydrogenase (short-subunit alcohol dehydrogenase family)